MPALLKKYHDREDGFTLIELLIVVLIIGILAAIAIPVYLGIQQQGYKTAVRSDVNISVKRVQVAVTEGASISDIKADPASYTQKSVKGENVYVAASTTSGAGTSDYQLSGVLNTSTTPAGPINYSYTYDSVTGNFTDSNSGLAFGSATPSITITTGSLTDGSTGSAYSATVSAAVVNPQSTTVWSASGLPSGWSINSATGVISAPAASVTTATSYPITVSVVNGAATDAHNYTIKVNSVPVVTTTSLPNGVSGTSYSQTLTASGSPAPIFAVASGSLPTGLTLTNAGVLAGTPSATGTFTFAVSASNTAGTSSAQSFTVTVSSMPAITTTAISGAVQNSSGYSTAIAATGSPSPTYSATGLPAGMSINTSTGVISGDAGTTATTYSPTVTVTNTAGSASKTYSLVVNPNILTNASFESGAGSWMFTPSGPAVNTSLNCPAGTITPYNGSNQLLFYSGDAGSGQYKTFLQDATTTVTAGKTYGAGMWLNGCSAAGQAGSLYFSEYDASGNITVMKQVPYTTTGGWTYVGTTVTAPVNGVGLRIQYVTTNGYGNVIFDYANEGLVQ